MAIYGRNKLLRGRGFGDMFTDQGAFVIPFSSVYQDGSGYWRAEGYGDFLGIEQTPGTIVFRNDAGSTMAVAYLGGTLPGGMSDTNAPSGAQPLGTFAYFAAEKFNDPSWVTSKLAAAPQFAQLYASDPGNDYFRIYGPFPVGGNDLQIMIWFAKVDYGGGLTAIAQDRADSESGWEGFLDNTFPMLATSFIFGGAIGSWAAATGAPAYGPVAAAQDLFNQASGAIDSILATGGGSETLVTSADVAGEILPYDGDVVLASGEDFATVYDSTSGYGYGTPESLIVDDVPRVTITGSVDTPTMEFGVGPTFDLPGGYDPVTNITYPVLEGGTGPTFDATISPDSADIPRITITESAPVFEPPQYTGTPIPDPWMGGGGFEPPIYTGTNIPDQFTGDEVVNVADEVPRITITEKPLPPDDTLWTGDGFTPTLVDGGSVTPGGVTTTEVIKTVTALGPTIIRTIWPDQPRTLTPTGGGPVIVSEGGPDDPTATSQTKSIFPWGLLLAALFAATGN